MIEQQVEQFQRDIDQWNELTQAAQLKGFTPESEMLLLEREYQLWLSRRMMDGLAADLVRCGIPLPEAAAHHLMRCCYLRSKQ